MNFEENLGYILIDFKNKKSDYVQTTLAIERLVMRCLGFTLFTTDLTNRVLTVEEAKEGSWKKKSG